MSDAFLERIAASTRRRVEERRLDLLPDRPFEFGPPERGALRDALRRPDRKPLRFLCEIKRASPSQGLLRPHFAPEDIARDYKAHGADAISVLTEPEFFRGHPEFLRTARRISRLPCLMKDFILDPFQIEEAVSYGADGVLLIVALLDQDQLLLLMETARIARLDVLVEVHDEVELQRALDAGAEIVGINARDLRTFEVDPTLPMQLRPRVPAGVVVVAESGISSPEAIQSLSDVGMDAVLIGEHFMRAPNLGGELMKLRRAAHDSAAGPS